LETIPCGNGVPHIGLVIDIMSYVFHFCKLWAMYFCIHFEFFPYRHYFCC